jgi:AcrR family transcriptional regulator
MARTNGKKPERVGAELKRAAPKRIRNPELRRQMILESALSLFSEKGYAGATLREIASRAGVTHGLLKLHFGSKENLFLSAVPGTRDWGDILLSEGRGSLAERISAAFGDRSEAGTGLDVLVTLLRAAAEDLDTAKVLFETVRDASVEMYEPLLLGDNRELRIEFLMAFLIGMTYLKYMVGSKVVSTMRNDDLKMEISNIVEKIISCPTERSGK